MTPSKTTNSISSKWVALHTGPETHLDHLGPLSALLDIPLIVTEESSYRLAKTFYPQIPVFLKDWRDLSLEYLADTYDVIFGCGKFWAIELKPLFELFHHKKMRFVFCPHGQSDKGHSHAFTIDQDIALIYGEQMMQSGNKETVLTGNYRYPFYRKHKNFYDKLADQHVFSRLDPKKQTILYAPTWQDGENPTSFFDAVSPLVEQLVDFNLIIKLHPLLKERYPAETYQKIGLYEKHSHALFLEAFPPIYPLLSRSSLYLGDFSSVGYDFLAFDRPLYFLTSQKGLFLQQCGIEIPFHEMDNLHAFIQKTLEYNQTHLSAQRRKAYAYAFGEERGSIELLQDIHSSLSSCDSSCSGGSTKT